MLKQFMNNNYAVKSYTNLNDRLLYIDYVERRYNYEEVSILPIEGYRHQGNLFGLFKLMGINPSLYIYAMYLNGYNNPVSYEGKKITFKVPVKVPIPEY